jgi:hypothetical protein
LGLTRSGKYDKLGSTCLAMISKVRYFSQVLAGLSNQRPVLSLKGAQFAYSVQTLACGHGVKK